MANHLCREKQVQAIHLICEGMSIRSVSRVTGVHQYTIGKLLLRVGEHCQQLLDERICSVSVQALEVDEVWTFCHKKERRCFPGDPEEWGNQFVFTALDPMSKLIVAHFVGKRNHENTYAFVDDLASRVVGRVQITTDQWSSYPGACYYSFGDRVGYGQVVKTFENRQLDDDYRYSPPPIVRSRKVPLFGMPRADLISTSLVERSNGTLRTFQRRFTRLTNGFSKRLPHLKASVALFVAWYNFCWIHRSLGMTPAMSAEITGQLWTVDRLVPMWPA